MTEIEKLVKSLDIWGTLEIMTRGYADWNIREMAIRGYCMTYYRIMHLTANSAKLPEEYAELVDKLEREIKHEARRAHEKANLYERRRASERQVRIRRMESRLRVMRFFQHGWYQLWLRRSSDRVEKRYGIAIDRVLDQKRKIQSAERAR